MIIRVGFLDKDENYISRLANYDSAHPSETVQYEVHLFTDAAAVKDQIARAGRLDVLVAEEELLGDPSEYLRRMAVAFWSDDKHEQSRNGCPTINRYQKASDVFRTIQGLSVGNGKHTSCYALDEKGETILFLAGAGGAGCTTAAAGCAAYMAARGKNTIYFSLKQNEESSGFHLSGSSMTEVRYELGMWRQLGGTDYSQLQLKLQSMLKQDDETGVLSFAPFDMPVSAMNLEADEVEGLLKALKGLCDVCVVAIDPYISPALLKAIRLADWTVIVSDSTPGGNEKTTKLLGSLEAIDSMDEKLIQGSLGVVYNQFGAAAEKTQLPAYVRELGVIPKYQNASRPKIARELSGSRVFEALER